MKNIYDMTLEKLENYFIENGEKKFKATQIFEWLYKKRIDDFFLMSNIKKELQLKLNDEFSTYKIKVIDKKEDKDVIKFLFELEDKNKIEAVLMNHDYGKSLCISTQVGCNMGCKFCESGRLKKVRNLETYEMVEQILVIEELQPSYVVYRIEATVNATKDFEFKRVFQREIKKEAEKGNLTLSYEKLDVHNV